VAERRLPSSPPPPAQSRLYSLSEACAAWGISLRTLEGHIREGHVPVVRMGRLRKISGPVFERLSRDGLPPNGSRRKKPGRRA
jgi:excisionase family DNA binding protein